MTLCRTKDGGLLRSASREAAPEGLEVVEVSKLSLADLQAAITAMRPEECFRLKWENHRDGALHVLRGKIASARRLIPLTERAAAILETRKRDAAAEWVFPALTRSGHIEKSSLKKQHLKACRDSKVERFPLYTLRHTCLTRWARTMDPYTLAYLAGHSDFATTKRYVHPQADTIREAIERAGKAQAPTGAVSTSKTQTEDRRAARAQLVFHA